MIEPCGIDVKEWIGRAHSASRSGRVLTGGLVPVQMAITAAGAQSDRLL